MLFWENIGQTLFLCQNQIVTIFIKQVVKQAVKGAEGNSEIVAISNKYKKTLHYLIDSSDPKSPNWLRPINKRSQNTSRFEGSSTGLLEKFHLDKDISDSLARRAPKIGNSQVHHQLNVVLFGPNNRRIKYEKDERGRKDKKSQKDREKC